MTKYKDIKDIIIFGSFVKDKFIPKDIDIAVIMQEKRTSVIGEISSKLQDKIHIEVLSPEQIYKSRLGLSIITEGFSIKENNFLREILGIKPKKIYVYSLKGLTSSEKRGFNRALKNHISRIKAKKLGAGSVMITAEKSGVFEDFLDVWNLKFKSDKYNVW